MAADPVNLSLPRPWRPWLPSWTRIRPTAGFPRKSNAVVIWWSLWPRFGGAMDGNRWKPMVWYGLIWYLDVSGWWWLEPWNFEWLSIYWECHHPNWRSPSFFRGIEITNQLWCSHIFCFTKKSPPSVCWEQLCLCGQSHWVSTTWGLEGKLSNQTGGFQGLCFWWKSDTGPNVTEVTHYHVGLPGSPYSYRKSC